MLIRKGLLTSCSALANLKLIMRSTWTSCRALRRSFPKRCDVEELEEAIFPGYSTCLAGSTFSPCCGLASESFSSSPSRSYQMLHF